MILFYSSWWTVVIKATSIIKRKWVNEKIKKKKDFISMKWKIIIIEIFI